MANLLRFLTVLLLLLLFLHGHGWAQGSSSTGSDTYDRSNHAVKVNCVTGCSAAGSFTDNSAFTVGSTAVTNLGAYFTSGAAPSISTGNSGRVRMDANSYLFTDCVVGCSGGSTTPADGFANPTTAGLTFSFPAVWNGTNWDRLYGDKTNGAFVNIKSSITLPVSGTFWQATQPVSCANCSGTITSNLGTTPDPCGPGQAKSYAFYDSSTNGATQLVALSGGKIVYVCSYSFSSSSTTANTLKLVYGTGSNCATGQTAMTPGIVLQAATSTGPIGKVNPNSAGLQTIASNELCVLTNAAAAAQAEVSYVQQ